MPRDGSGNHSLPAGYEAVTGQTITANQHNQPLEDLSDEITASLPRSGVAAMTGNLPMGGNKITGLGTPTATTDAATKAYVDAAGVADGAKGDITVSSSGATWTVTQATLAAIRALTGAANKIAMFTSSSAATLLDFKDEDDMSSDSDTAVPSQQSVKAYVDANGGSPTGSVVAFAGTSAPTGWLFAYGQAVSRTTYAALFSAIGTTYGSGDGSTTFNLPDLRGRVVAGKDDMGGSSANRLTDQTNGVNGDVLGDTGGAETHVLTEAQLASHNHLLPFRSSGAGGVTSVVTINGNTPGTISSSDAGSGEAHNNVQPTIILNYIIKT